MKITKQQFREYLFKQEGNIAKAKTTETYHGVPANTELTFGIPISTYDNDTHYENRKLNLDYDFEWFWGCYKGEFIIEDDKVEVTKEGKKMKTKEEERVELEYNLLETTKEKAGQIVQFLISYHELNENDFDFSK
jgi:hypothetical protein